MYDLLDLPHRRRKIAVFPDDVELLAGSTLWFAGQDILKCVTQVERLRIILGRCRSRRRGISYRVNICVR